MGEDKPGDGLPDITQFVLQAKYGKDEETCRAAGAKVIDCLHEHGRYSAMIDLCIDPGTPPFLAEDTRKHILAAAFTACKNSGTFLPLQDVATRPDVPLEIALHAGVALVMRYSEPYDESKLMGILKDKRFHDKARAEAGKAIISNAEKGLKYSTLFCLATSQDIIYDVKKPAGLILIRLAVELGNYPILLALEKEKILPVDIRIALEDKVEEAVKSAIRLACAEQESAILIDISEDSRLPASIRGRSMGYLHGLKEETHPGESEAPDPQMTAELMYRLGKNAGTARSSVAPQPSSERPTYKEPLTRPKR